MEKINDEQLKRELGFDLYGRYAIIRNIIDNNRNGGERFRVLDVGGRGNMLRKFLPNDDVFYLDPFVESKDENFIKGDGCEMPLENESFDWVVSADVFEHIPKGKRKDFLEENLRVAKLGVLLMAPFYTKEVKQAEINANENYKILTGGKDHIWLKEHIQNKLPDITDFENILKEKEVSFQKIYNNGLFLWQTLIGISFLVSENFDDDIKKELEEFNHFYNTEVFPFDNQEPSYRKIYFIKKDPNLKNMEISGREIDNELFLKTIKKGLDLINKINVKNKDFIQQKEAQFNEVVNSLRWKIPNYFYKLYKNEIKKYIPKFLFKTLNYTKDFFNKKVKVDEDRNSNGKCIKDVLSMQISGAKNVTFKKYSEPKVSIIILAYNKWQFTYKCLKSVRKNTKGIEYEIIVIDNASSDDTKLLFDKVKNVKYIRNNENRGFAKACNQGAREAKGEYILFLNNDIVAKRGWLVPMIDELDNNENSSMVGSKLLFPNGTVQHAGVGFAKDKIPFHLYYKENPKEPKTCERKLYDAVTAACILIRRNDFFEVGGFDENYVNGLEDIDLCLKIRDAGKDIVYRPDSVLYHFESMSEGRFDYAQKNVELFMGKWDKKISAEDGIFIR